MPNISENNTGAFRRVLSKTGFAFEAADIHLPGGNNISTLAVGGGLKPSGDTVYVYLGGRGSSGGEVDAGFQYSAAKNNWSLFLAVSKFGFTYGPSPGAPVHPRFAADQTVHLEFEVVAPDVLEVRGTGILDGGGTPVTLAIRVDASAFPLTHSNVEADLAGTLTGFGWDPAGGGNRLKRVTSLAQIAGHEDFDTGSFVHGVDWSNCTLGKTKSAAAAWKAADISSTVVRPSDGTISFETFSPSAETVSVDF